jgi:hypothetical protein
VVIRFFRVILSDSRHIFLLFSQQRALLSCVSNHTLWWITVDFLELAIHFKLLSTGISTSVDLSAIFFYDIMPCPFYLQLVILLIIKTGD